MQRSKRFKSIVKYTQFLKQQAEQALGKAQTELQLQHNRLKELQGYQGDYTSQFHQRAQSTGLSSLQLNDYQAFLNKLKSAIAQQYTRVQHAEQELQRKRQHWIAMNGKFKAMETLQQRHERREEKEAERVEQTENDERALIKLRSSRQSG